MMSRGLVDRFATSAGIEYRAAEKASSYLASLMAPYSLELRSRAAWAVSEFGDMPIGEIKGITRRFFEHWSSQFQVASPRPV
jgi:hypothetical protein